jgi:outer membrane protein assembly factor BamB
MSLVKNVMFKFKAIRLVTLIVSSLALTGCEALMEPGGLFGDELKVRLSGERISVLRHQRSLNPDAELSAIDILLPAPSANANWPQAGGYANHAMHHIEIGESINLAWSSDIGAGSNDELRLIGTPIIAAGRIYTMDASSNVSAFDTKTGKIFWRTSLTPDEEDDDHMSGGLAFEDGKVYVTTGFAEVVALNASSGKVIWRTTLPGPMRSAPTVRNGRVFAMTVDSRLYALNGATGDEIWNYIGIPEIASLLGGASPAVDNGVVVAPFPSGELVALKVENGRVLWTEALLSTRKINVVSTLAHIRGQPIIDRGQVFAISHGGMMVSIDLRSGRRIWGKEIGGLSNPWVAGDYIFLLTNDAEVVAISRKSGSIHWVQTLPQYEDPQTKDKPIIWNGPILASDRLLLASSLGLVYSMSPYDGRIMGSVEMPSGISVPPVIAERSVYFLADNASLLAYR